MAAPRIVNALGLMSIRNIHMPRKPDKERVAGRHFMWLLGTRNGVYYADGRSNRWNLGRHSLGVRDRQKALENLRRLDVVKAVEFGLADRASLEIDESAGIALEEGQRLYLEYAARPPVQGGTSPSSVKRYRAVLDKFLEFAKARGLRYWDQVTQHVLRRYGKWLEEQDYGDATQYLELTTLKQVLKWMVAETLLPASSLVVLRLRKPNGTSTYCYSRAQVQAMVAYCSERDDLRWLAHVVIALATTGLRISELSGLRWQEVDLERQVLHLRDTSRRSRRSTRQDARTTKSHRDRSLPIHSDLRAILIELPRHVDGRVFHGPRGGKLKPDTVRNVLTRDVLAPLSEQFPPSISDKGIRAGRVHSFRHYFCSMSADSDVPEQMLMAWLGHQDSKMIRHYYHLRQEESRKQMARISFLASPKSKTGGS